MDIKVFSYVVGVFPSCAWRDSNNAYETKGFFRLLGPLSSLPYGLILPILVARRTGNIVAYLFLLDDLGDFPAFQVGDLVSQIDDDNAMSILFGVVGLLRCF